MCEEGGSKLRISAVFVVRLTSVSCSLFLSVLYNWSLCHLELTRLQSATESCDTNHNPAFILLYQPHPLSLSPSFFSCNMRYSLSPSLLSPPPTLACSLSFLFPLLLQPSLIRFGKPLASPFYPLPPSTPPSTDEHPLHQAWSKKTKMLQSSAMFNTDKTT